MESIFGVIFHSIGGFASGSFYIPYNRVKSWAWESAWIVGGIFSWLIVPYVAAYLTIPDFMGIIQQTDNTVLFWTFLMGLLWGIGGLTFGLAMRYLGMSLGMSIALSLCSVFGSLVPAIYRDVFTADVEGTFSYMISHAGGQVVLLGVLVCILGIVVCGKAVMALTALAPERIDQLVAIDIAPVDYQVRRHDDIFAAINAVSDAGASTRQQAAALMREHINEEGVIQFLLKSFVDGAWRFNVPVLWDQYLPIS